MNALDEEKWMYEKFWCLLNDKQLMRVFEKFGPAAFRRSSVLEGFENFIKAHKFAGETVCEIGTLKGLTAVVLARYFKRVVTVDILDDEQKYEIARMLGINNIKFINVDDDYEKAAVLATYGFDAAYIDGDHTHDTESDFALVRRCGQVLMHENWSAQPSVLRLVGGLSNIVAGGKFALWRDK